MHLWDVLQPAVKKGWAPLANSVNNLFVDANTEIINIFCC